MKTNGKSRLRPETVEEYHIFLASPSDMDTERRIVRVFFDEFNRHIARNWGVRFEVIDYENYSSAGVGRPQELITSQTLERYRDSLALVIGLMGQRFGSPTGKADSGTEEEFNWALAANQEKGFPEIKWYFRGINTFVAPPDLDQLYRAVQQWEKVREFRSRLESQEQPVFFREFSDVEGLKDLLHNDLAQWLNDPCRCWVKEVQPDMYVPNVDGYIVKQYFQSLFDEFRWLDISGIDNDRTFQIPLSEMYVRLSVVSNATTGSDDGSDALGSGSIDIHTALKRYRHLVIVGDPGSGKSTFLRYISLMISRSKIERNLSIASEALGLTEPLPIPIYLSCWGLSNHLRNYSTFTQKAILKFILETLDAYENPLDLDQLKELLNNGICCFLIDGLDEIPTNQGRAIVSRLVEKFVERYKKNRFVVTSRIRAYTGEAVLKQKFVRCDIQPLEPDDRCEFLRNWFSLLFKTQKELVSSEGSESARAFFGLLDAIERNDRIKVLAINPLLLTVIAIVHWNRKRLPEQRIDIYDECVDVLLGQRREAEHVWHGKGGLTFDEVSEDRKHENRAWVRKRLAEVALRILESGYEEITKDDIISLIKPRLRERRNVSDEEATILSQRFLERQELQSGLLVSRRSQQYRFVHLTFQEYLAAWNLSNQDFKTIKTLISPNLFNQDWFEPLQLLGGEWAKRSDDLLDRYICFLLNSRGQTIQQQAPIVALCSNILNDSTGIAEVKTSTQENYEQALKSTLLAFKKEAKIPETNQLEILEALSKFGLQVKGFILKATDSSHTSVRTRALELLIHYSSVEELFEIQQVLDDPSEQPVNIYLDVLLAHDLNRTTKMLLEKREPSSKLKTVLVEKIGLFAKYEPPEEVINLFHNTLLEVAPKQIECLFLDSLVEHFGKNKETWTTLYNVAENASNGYVRAAAIAILASHRSDDDKTWKLISRIAKNDRNQFTRSCGLLILAFFGRDSSPWNTAAHLMGIEEEEHWPERSGLLDMLANNLPNDERSWQLIAIAAKEDKDSYVRRTALELLLRHKSHDSEIMSIITEAAGKDESIYVRRSIVRKLLPTGEV